MRTSLTTLAALLLLGAVGCADMKDQERHEPLEASAFFDDGASSRPLVEGTVPRGHLREDDRIYRGVDADGAFVTEIPVEIRAEQLHRGRERYDIFCSPCHARSGNGQGMIVRRGYKQPPSFHEDRLRGMPHGYFYDVITNGFGTMSSYASQIKPADRWAIVAYLRTLQLAQSRSPEELPAEIRRRLENEDSIDMRDREEDDHGSAGH